MAFKIALNAGHYSKTLGKRCLKKLDKNETREWVLNDRICALSVGVYVLPEKGYFLTAVFDKLFNVR